MHHVLEINSAPGLDHYAKMGKAQENIVEDVYLGVLKHMEHERQSRERREKGMLGNITTPAFLYTQISLFLIVYTMHRATG